MPKNIKKRITKRKTKRKTKYTLKRMNCSPAVKGKTVSRDSCLTPEILRKVKDYYNMSHPNTPITKDAPSKIWISLKQRLKTCDKEDCWLDLITDDEVRNTIDSYIFAPDQPSSWKNKPNKWLSTNDIHKILLQYQVSHPNFRVIRPTPLDFDAKIGEEKQKKCVTEELCNFDLNNEINNGKTKFGLVFNLDKHDQPGSHWVALYIDADSQITYYMDSVGDSAPIEIQNLIGRIKEQASLIGIDITEHETHVSHQRGNTECGMYCLYFIITMLTGETEDTTLNTMDDRIALFKGSRIPDKYISEFRNKYFNT